MTIFRVMANWDADALVWWAKSEDVPGLVAEAPTIWALVSELRQIIPEMVTLNLPDVDVGTVMIDLMAGQHNDAPSWDNTPIP